MADALVLIGAAGIYGTIFWFVLVYPNRRPLHYPPTTEKADRG